MLLLFKLSYKYVTTFSFRLHGRRMTVTYIQHVHTAGNLGTFTGLLPIWKGGVFKAIWRGLLIYVMLYGTISVIYRFVLSKDETAKLNFERLCVYCESSIGFIPLSFILGFYVTQVGPLPIESP